MMSQTIETQVAHQHAEYAHRDGQFVCCCGAVRLAVGHWASDTESLRLRTLASRETRMLKKRYGTAVDAYGQRLSVPGSQKVAS